MTPALSSMFFSSHSPRRQSFQITQSPQQSHLIHKSSLPQTPSSLSKHPKPTRTLPAVLSEHTVPGTRPPIRILIFPPDHHPQQHRTQSKSTAAIIKPQRKSCTSFMKRVQVCVPVVARTHLRREACNSAHSPLFRCLWRLLLPHP